MGVFTGVRHRRITEHTRVSPGHTRRRLIMMPTRTSVRALGETDLNPVSGLGKISQLVFAVVQPSNVVANLIAGGVLLVTLEPSSSLLTLSSRCGGSWRAAVSWWTDIEHPLMVYASTGLAT